MDLDQFIVVLRFISLVGVHLKCVISLRDAKLRRFKFGNFVVEVARGLLLLSFNTWFLTSEKHEMQIHIRNNGSAAQIRYC